jgi:hypothetical protein
MEAHKGWEHMIVYPRIRAIFDTHQGIMNQGGGAPLGCYRRSSPALALQEGFLPQIGGGEFRFGEEIAMKERGGGGAGRVHVVVGASSSCRTAD